MLPIKEKIIRALRDLQASEQMLDEVTHCNDQLILDWVRLIDESNYSLQSWCEALIRFKAWEESEGRFLPLSQKIEYLSCCSEGGQAGGRLITLTLLLEQYLKEHGVD